LAARPGRGVDGRQFRLHVRAQAAALMAGYIVAGVVALVVTIYLFVALLFPERF
jgi:K+-transporting ATPase KdpF subunit